MKKNIKWLKEEVEKQNIVMGKGYIYTSDLLYLIDNLDEPEVLSKDWIDEHAVAVSYDGIPDETEIIYVDELKNLIVPRQELPVIPKYVADWIKEEQGTMSNWKLPSRFISDSKYKKDQRRYKWSQVEGNMDKFMSVLINSYEVEDEPLYYALVKGHELVDIDGTYWIYDKNNDDMFISGLHPLDGNFLKAMSKDTWNKLGINDSNADFIKVEEVAK